MQELAIPKENATLYTSRLSAVRSPFARRHTTAKYGSQQIEKLPNTKSTTCKQSI